MRAGLGAIIPLQLLTTLSPLEMELRTCGLPYINLEFLKVGGLGWGYAGRRRQRGPVLVLLCASTPAPPTHTPLTAKLAEAGLWQHVAGSASYPDRWPPGPRLGPHPERRLSLLSPLPSPARPALAPASFPQARPRHPRVASCQLRDLARVTSRPVGTVTGPAQCGRGVTQVKPLLLGLRCRLQSHTQALGQYLPSLCHRHDPHGRRPLCPCRTRPV